MTRPIVRGSQVAGDVDLLVGTILVGLSIWLDAVMLRREIGSPVQRWAFLGTALSSLSRWAGALLIAAMVAGWPKTWGQLILGGLLAGLIAQFVVPGVTFAIVLFLNRSERR